MVGRYSSELVILIDCMIFLSPFLEVRKMSMSAVSFLAQLDSSILCLSVCASFSCNSIPCSGCWALHGVKSNSKKLNGIYLPDFLKEFELLPIAAYFRSQVFFKQLVVKIFSCKK